MRQRRRSELGIGRHPLGIDGPRGGIESDDAIEMLEVDSGRRAPGTVPKQVRRRFRKTDPRRGARGRSDFRLQARDLFDVGGQEMESVASSRERGVTAAPPPQRGAGENQARCRREQALSPSDRHRSHEGRAAASYRNARLIG